MDPQPGWFRALEFTEEDGQLYLRPEWIDGSTGKGREPVDILFFKPGEISWRSCFQRNGTKALLTAYTNKGLIVLAAYMSVTDKPDDNVLCRDFFVPVLERNTAIESGSLHSAGQAEFLLGSWINAEPRTGNIARVEINRDGEGRFFLQAFGSFDQECMDWGKTNIQIFWGAHGQMGFHATYAFGDQTMELVGNAKLGVVVILCCTSFHDNSGRPGYMTRSFFRLEGQSESTANNPAAMGFAKPADLTPFEGDWRNTADQPLWLKEFSLHGAGDGWRLRARSIEEDLGETDVVAYRDNMGSTAFSGEFRVSGSRVTLTSNNHKGMVAITSFQRYDDSHRNRAYREFFYTRNRTVLDPSRE